MRVFNISTALRRVEFTLDDAAATAAAVAGLVVMAEIKLEVDVIMGVVGPVLGGTEEATLEVTLGAMFGALTESGEAAALDSVSSNFTKLSSSSLSETCSDDNSSLLSAVVTAE